MSTDSTRLAEFRRRMEAFRASREVEKQSGVVLLDVIAWYRTLDGDEQRVADQVVAEWAGSENETDRHDARVMTQELRIGAALPALRRLRARLADATDVHSRYELAALDRALAALDADG